MWPLIPMLSEEKILYKQCLILLTSLTGSLVWVLLKLIDFWIFFEDGLFCIPLLIFYRIVSIQVASTVPLELRETYKV